MVPGKLLDSATVEGMNVSVAKARVESCQAFGEMEESCLLLCHFYLPTEKRTSM
jgi:hypothetical protein